MQRVASADYSRANQTTPLPYQRSVRVQKWIQLDLFTGEPMPPRTADTEKQERIAKTTRLALEVQLSIARLDRLADTMKLVSELCETLTGVAYPVDINERHRTYQRKQQQQTENAVASENYRASFRDTTNCELMGSFFCEITKQVPAKNIDSRTIHTLQKKRIKANFLMRKRKETGTAHQHFRDTTLTRCNRRPP